MATPPELSETPKLEKKQKPGQSLPSPPCIIRRPAHLLDHNNVRAPTQLPELMKLPTSHPMVQRSCAHAAKKRGIVLNRQRHTKHRCAHILHKEVRRTSRRTMVFRTRVLRHLAGTNTARPRPRRPRRARGNRGTRGILRRSVVRRGEHRIPAPGHLRKTPSQCMLGDASPSAEQDVDRDGRGEHARASDKHLNCLPLLKQLLLNR